MRTTPKPGSLVGLTKSHFALLESVAGGAVFQLAALGAFPAARVLVDSLRARGLVREVQRLPLRGAPVQYVITDFGCMTVERFVAEAKAA